MEELSHACFAIMLPDLPEQVSDCIFVGIWIIIAIFFLSLAKSSRKLEKNIDELKKSIDASDVGCSVNEYGRAVFLDPKLGESVKELLKVASSMLISSKTGFILSSIAAILAILQLIF